jgi:hypothetical protein
LLIISPDAGLVGNIGNIGDIGNIGNIGNIGMDIGGNIGGDNGDFLYLRYDDNHDISNNDESHYVNEMDIFYPMRKAYFYDQSDSLPNEPRLRLPLRSSMRNGVGAMMDRLRSIRRLPNYPNTTFYRHYKE